MSIHTNTKLFGNCKVESIEEIYNSNDYEEPDNLMVQLTHRDVVLDYFKGKTDLIKYLRSGMLLSISGDYLTARLNNRDVFVAKLSKAFIEKMDKLSNKGYLATSAQIRFLVYWKGKNDTEESLIILSDMYFKKDIVSKD